MLGGGDSSSHRSAQDALGRTVSVTGPGREVLENSTETLFPTLSSRELSVLASAASLKMCRLSAAPGQPGTAGRHTGSPGALLVSDIWMLCLTSLQPSQGVLS